MHCCANREESRGAHAHEDFPDRDDKNWLKHSAVFVDSKGNTKIDYRPGDVDHAYKRSRACPAESTCLLIFACKDLLFIAFIWEIDI